MGHVSLGFGAPPSPCTGKGSHWYSMGFLIFCKARESQKSLWDAGPEGNTRGIPYGPKKSRNRLDHAGWERR